MALEGWYVKKVFRKDITSFIETHHYSKSINGCISDYNFALYNPNNELCGAMFYGRMAMYNQWKRFKKYGAEKESDVIELRRLVLINNTPKNAESFFISRSIKKLRRLWKGKIIVSYADKEYGHNGTIYRASNFKEILPISGARVIINSDGKRYHDKSIRTKYKGILKPFATRLIKELKDGKAYYKNTKGKHSYIYIMNNRKKNG